MEVAADMYPYIKEAKKIFGSFTSGRLGWVDEYLGPGGNVKILPLQIDTWKFGADENTLKFGTGCKLTTKNGWLGSWKTIFFGEFWGEPRMVGSFLGAMFNF